MAHCKFSLFSISRIELATKDFCGVRPPASVRDSGLIRGFPMATVISDLGGWPRRMNANR